MCKIRQLGVIVEVLLMWR